ncbi:MULTISPECIES: Crp/Fnr family transcriptional regulator [Desulfovibrio]|uniref:cAMP-binding domain of CRP or a regulatory subunit of cAMP-dependent protein kinases n=3 Tax=Desulfovibrio TaxID=872 RepID=A0AA94L390_DESDE|nr:MULTISPECIES: helix-turn-helix domain-containing protein [Desulfovibrio]ATD82169.1 Crp/Fnr family transcriptional regulator [Desulfovibrio sp. G11]MDY0204881.1 Crp/Fnr family transcriptional regulator [Desulfovibrio desulfuricans]SFW68292.1 cAMP-binding domain of CRP or a regulatory subunit of cAMP-dependent protein kinases [Desulfovibrio desulfuricans]SPD34871.1 RmlC-like jelly roll fold [Desulfovibrio sp. G11]
MKFSNINLLDELSRPEFAPLLAAFHERLCPRQSIIFTPRYDDHLSDQEPQKQESFVFIVKSGLVRVYLSCEEREFTIGFLKPGDLFVSHSNALVQAVDDSAILLLDTPTFNRGMISMPEFTMPIVRVLGGMLKSCFSIIDGLALRDVTVRLARLLTDLPREEDGQTPGSLIRLPLSGEKLAQSLGTSRQTISTLLTDFTRLGILHKEQRGLYRILDEERLRELLR